MQTVGRYGELSHAAHAEWLRRLAGEPGADTLAIGDGFAVRTGSDSNTDNGVVCSRASDREIAAALAFLDGVPATWLSAAGDLGRRLERAGARPERTAVVMGARVADLRLGSSAAEVRAADELATWREIAGPEYVRVRLEPARHAYALLDGRAVGLVSWIHLGDAVHVQHVMVRAEHRRRGIGRMLIAHAVRGAAEAVLDPTPDSAGFYARLGFELEACPPDRWFYLSG
jgi:GNAT superfamily N-acetyltransferase